MTWRPARAVFAFARRSRGGLLWMTLAAALAALAWSSLQLWRVRQDNRVIAALQSGRDVEVAVDAAPSVVFARASYLLERDRLDPALPFVERLAADAQQRGADARALAAAALYNLGNARMRQALTFLEADNLSGMPASVRLAKDYYARALRFEPQHWDAKYNLDVAARLVRDFPDNDPDDEGEPPNPLSRLWTELPGLPKGLP